MRPFQQSFLLFTFWRKKNHPRRAFHKPTTQRNERKTKTHFLNEFFFNTSLVTSFISFFYHHSSLVRMPVNGKADFKHLRRRLKNTFRHDDELIKTFAGMNGRFVSLFLNERKAFFLVDPNAQIIFTLFTSRHLTRDGEKLVSRFLNSRACNGSLFTSA